MASGQQRPGSSLIHILQTLGYAQAELCPIARAPKGDVELKTIQLSNLI